MWRARCEYRQVFETEAAGRVGGAEMRSRKKRIEILETKVRALEEARAFHWKAIMENAEAIKKMKASLSDNKDAHVNN